MKIGVCQTICLDGDREGNFVRMESAVRDAAGGGAEVVCLPEMAVLGWVNPAAHERAFTIPGADTARLCHIACEYGVYLSVGLCEKDGDDLYDSAVLISDSGELLGRHRKMNLLSELMDPPYCCGGEVGVIETKFGKVGLLICADTHDDEILDQMAGLGPDLLLVPYGYAEVEDKWPEHGLQLEQVVCHAGETVGAVTVGTNCVGRISNGPWSGRVYGGHSVVADGHGRVIAVAADRDRDVIIVDAGAS